MPPRFGGEPVEQESAPRFKGEAVAEDTSYLPPINPPKEKKPTIGERGKEVGFATGLSAAAGAIAPEILMYGVAPAAGVFAPTAPFAPAIYGAGAALRGSRLAQAGLGAIGGFTGETAGQVAEATGAKPLTAEAARFAGGIIGPEFATSIRKAVSYGAKKLTGLGTESAIKSVMSDIGISDKEITPSQKEFIRKQIEALRGGPSSSQAQKNIYESMAGGAQDIRSEAARRAEETTQRGAATRSALESQAEKMRLAQGKTTAIGEKALKDVQNERASIGSDREASDIGLSIREKINTVFGTQTEQRSAAYKAQEEIRDSAVAAKESVGNLVKDTPEYKVLVTDLRNKLLIGLEAQQQKTAPVTEKGVLQAYQNIYDAVTARRVQTGVNDKGNPVFETFPTSFGALDDVRRRLGDVAFGKDVEGYSAIGANIAKNYYKTISEIQSKFAGEAHDVLQGEYEMASRLLDKYKSKAGQKITALDRFDPTRYKTDPAAITNDFFKTKQGVADLIELTGGDKALVTKSASDHTARSLRDKNASSVKKWIDSNNDWLESLPEIKSKAQAYLTKLERAERISGKTETAAKILTAREPTTLRAGEAATVGAEKESAKIIAEAEKKADLILKNQFPADRVKELFLSGAVDQWREITPILAQTPKGKETIGEAVRQIMASRAESGLRTAPEFFRDKVRPPLEAGNLLPKRELDNIEFQLTAIKNSTMPDAEKFTLMQRIVKNAIVSYAVPGVGRLVTPSKKSDRDVINKPGAVGPIAPRFSNK